MIPILGRNPFLRYKLAQIKEPTPEQLHELAPKVNMFFALSMLLESIAVDLQHEVMIEHSIAIREKIDKFIPDQSDSFGNWADYVETVLSENTNKRELAWWTIAKIYALSVEITKFYRKFDSQFTFFADNAVKGLISNRGMKFRKHEAIRLNKLVIKLMEE